MKHIAGKRLTALFLAGVLMAGSPEMCLPSVQAVSVESRAVDLSTIGSSISQMFEVNDANTWLFAGGVETQGRYAEIQGNRSYVGHFEECVRRNGDGSGLQHHRYTISVGKAGQDLSGFLAKLDGEDGYIRTLDPRAIVYLIGEEDYDKGAGSVENFKTDLTSLITKALAMKNNSGFAVIQLPHAVNDTTDMGNAGLYANAAKEAVSNFSADQLTRVVLVDYYTSTNTDAFKNGGNLTEDGRLSAKGHLEIARQLCTATIKNLGNTFPTMTTWVEEESPEIYLTDRPEVSASADALQVKIPETVNSQSAWNWKLEMNDLLISGEAAGNSFTIDRLPANKEYKLTLCSKDGSTQLSSVYGKVSEGKTGGEQKLTSLQQKIADKVNGEEPLTWLFTGDSITHGLVHTKGYDSVAQAFEKYVREDLGRADDVVINTGVSSTDSTWLLENIETRVTKYKPDIVSVMIGTNDVYTNVNNFHKDKDGQWVKITVDVYRQNLKNIVQKIREANPDACIIFRSATPTRQGGRDTYLTNGYLQAMEEVAKEDGGIIFVDQYYDWDKEIRTFPYLWNANFYFNDTNLHPGAAGQLRMMQQFVRETGLNTDTRLANLSYKFTYTENASSVTPQVVYGADRIKVARSDLQSAYTAAGGTGTIGALEITLTAEDGRTYTQSTEVNGADFVMKGIPFGTYTVKVVGTLTERAEHVTFGTQTVTLSEDQEPEYDVLLDNLTITELSAGQKVGVFTVDEMAPEGSWTYSLCDGEGNRDNARFEILGRTLKIRTELAVQQEYQIRVKAVNGGYQKEQTFVIRTGKNLSAVRTEAQESFAADKMALDMDVHDFNFNGTDHVNAADASGAYYDGGSYLQVLNNLKESSTGGTIIFRFKTSQKGGVIFGAGSTAADDGTNMIFGLDSNGMLRGLFRIRSGNGLKGSFGRDYSDGEWHTVAMSFDTAKADCQNQLLISVDGGDNLCTDTTVWWTEQYKTWFSANSTEIRNLVIGGGAYGSVNSMGSFNGSIDFVTVTDEKYSEEELRILSREATQAEEPETIAAVEGIAVSGDTVNISENAGYEASDIVWNGSIGTFVLTAKDGCRFDEAISVAALEIGGKKYTAKTAWQTEQEVIVTLTEAEPEQKPDDNQGNQGEEKPTEGNTETEKPGQTVTPPEQKPIDEVKPPQVKKPAATKKVTAKQVKRKAQVKITWKKVKNAKAYVIYRSVKKNKGYVKIKTLKGAKKISYIDKKVKKGKKYYYRIVVKTKDGYSAPKTSKVVKVKK